MCLGEWVPIMTLLQTAPDAALHLVKCGCAKEKCSTKRCQCRKARLINTPIFAAAWMEGMSSVIMLLTLMKDNDEPDDDGDEDDKDDSEESVNETHFP